MNNNENVEFINQMLSAADLLHQDPAEQVAQESSDLRQTQEDEVLELGDNFDFDGFQVVRREFFAHISEPSVTFNNCKFYVNAACLQKFPDVDTVAVGTYPQIPICIVGHGEDVTTLQRVRLHDIIGITGVG